MIQYRKGRFHIPGMSFIIPDGFFLDTTPDSVAENCLCLVSPNNEYDVFIQASPSKGSTFDDLSAILRNTGDHTQVPDPVTVNGIHGHHVKYKAGNEQYYELRLRNPFNDQEYAQLTLLFSRSEKNDEPLQDAFAVNSIVEGIRLETY